eukprot:CAMPEP_0201094602 /NCGR_PEP_ID=MMETSP0812-20130820/3001_1 /ASSEMBLY_ACC=CAM_ASM_000668 /TAXON_ID=98059 /ORGANISM="Dinobryon sp., Strain UTEXLB2267" /LENGTH=99 /DNA_ID=CAMNT_0047347361 /DNA_START=29 /DNA_END=326 /DNA_ORIENTATION=-
MNYSYLHVNRFLMMPFLLTHYEFEWSGAKVKSKEVEYGNASAAKSDNNKTHLLVMYEQEITELRNANKVIEAAGWVLHHYYGKYITTEYGLGSAYESGF